MTLKIGANQPSSITLISDKLRQKTDESAINSARQDQNAIENLNRRMAVKKPDTKGTNKTVGDFLGHVLTKQPLEEKGKEKKVYLDVKYPKPPEQMTVKDYQTALTRAEYKQAGLGMLTDDEIKTSEDALADQGLKVKYYGFDLASLQNDQRSGKPLFTTDYMIERAQRGGQAVLQYREYQSLSDDAKAEYARRYAPEAIGGFVQPIVNAPVNIANSLSEPFRAGERALFGTSYIPEIPRMQVAERSEYWNKDGRMLINKGAEIGATITFGGMAGSRALATQSGRFLLGTESAYNIGAGIGGKDITQTDANGNARQMPLLERGLRVTGGLFGARSVINAEIAAPNSAVNKLDDIFKNNTPKPQAEMVTPNGFRVKVPQTNKSVNTTVLESRKNGFPGIRIPSSNGSWEGEVGNSGWKSTKPEVIAVTKGKSVEFKNGFPDFSPWSKGEVKLPNMKGNYTSDFEDADELFATQNKWFKADGSPDAGKVTKMRSDESLTWHHHEDRETMLLVPKDLNNKISHTGGGSLSRRNSMVSPDK